MKKTLLLLALLLCSTQLIYSQDQEEGVPSFSLPIRNSFRYNTFLLNPTFSFVKEQGSTFALYNKTQWLQFENAPITYVFSYSGRLKENEGIGVSLYQQNLGIFTTFGGVVNFAHNVVLAERNNLTFGLNVGFYKSGINNAAVLFNDLDDSILGNLPSNSLLTVNPGINYGGDTFNIGVSANNIVLYNLNTSKIVQEDPEKNIQAHFMYTGYIDGSGFFDRSKFSALVRTEVKKPKTVISGLMMFTIPQGVWAQLGYNTVYGASGGLGMNLTKNISIEYNYERGISNFSNFGGSHEVTLAYKFNRSEYAYEDEEGYIIHQAERRKVAPKTTPAKEKAEPKQKPVPKEKNAKDPNFKFKEIKEDKKKANNKAKETEPKAKEIDIKAKEIEPKVKEIDIKAKGIEPKAKEIDIKAKGVEPKAKEIDIKAKGIEPKVKEIKANNDNIPKPKEKEASKEIIVKPKDAEKEVKPKEVIEETFSEDELTRMLRELKTKQEKLLKEVKETVKDKSDQLDKK